MRYLFGFLCVCALSVVPLSQSASAQDAEEDATSEPNLQEPATPSEPAPEEPALQLRLDAAGVEVAPSTPRTEYLKTHVRRARIGLSVSVMSFAGGVAMMGVAFANVEVGARFCLFGVPCPETPSWVIPVAVSGTFITIGGLTGMIISGRKLADGKKQLRWYAGASKSRCRRPRRARWDLARSRVVF
jgi:hypothetical protein